MGGCERAGKAAMPHRARRHSTAQHSTAQHSTAQHSAAQRSAAQRSAAQRSTAQELEPPKGRSAGAHLVFVHAPHHDDVDLDCGDRGWARQAEVWGASRECMRAGVQTGCTVGGCQSNRQTSPLPRPLPPSPAPRCRRAGAPTWVEAQRQRLLDGAQHALVALAPRHRQESLRAQRVQRDVEQRQACMGWCMGEGWWWALVRVGWGRAGITCSPLARRFPPTRDFASPHLRP